MDYLEVYILPVIYFNSKRDTYEFLIYSILHVVHICINMYIQHICTQNYFTYPTQLNSYYFQSRSHIFCKGYLNDSQRRKEVA